jgi:predicted O-linked N-acetylglucosamine transferase (SPINDLY family)
MGQRMKRAFDRFIDASGMTNQDIARLIRQLEVDIAVDLMGFTEGSRTDIFAQRAAPIQINYLGYPGTMGAPYIDYIIADRVVVPHGQQKFYSEKIIYMPDSFQANDRNRHMSSTIFTRQQLGLPAEAFVFCCFNNSYKITPVVFDVWMRILNRVRGGVLWLVASDKTVQKNLRTEAAARGVDPERLIFAERVPYAEYLSRLSAADLFLDTAPYNAGATASDALWAVLPVLTYHCDAFVGRMGASLLSAIGLPELVTATPQAYEELAVELATSPGKLRAIKDKLDRNRLTTPLFDTQRFIRHIEAAYTQAYRRYQAGLPPDHIQLPQ